MYCHSVEGLCEGAMVGMVSRFVCTVIIDVQVAEYLFESVPS